MRVWWEEHWGWCSLWPSIHCHPQGRVWQWWVNPNIATISHIKTIASTFLTLQYKSISGHYYSYVRPDIRQNKWFRFDDEFVTEVDYSDVVADAYGGNRRTRRKRSRSDSFEASQQPAKRRRGLFQRLLSLFGFFRRLPMIGSSSGGGGGFGYGGRASNAYMLQYARRSDIPKLYLEDKWVMI